MFGQATDQCVRSFDQEMPTSLPFAIRGSRLYVGIYMYFDVFMMFNLLIYVCIVYGPCVQCREWMLKSTLKRHQSKCIAQRAVEVSPLTKRNLVMQSDILSGHLKTTASSFLQKEVFAIMTPDTISDIEQRDLPIVALGISRLRRNVDNKLKRKYYASQRMRLNARLLIALRKEDARSESMWEFLVPQKFDSIAKAAITVAMPTMEDEEDLKSPSNAIKLKYDCSCLSVAFPSKKALSKTKTI